MAYRKWTWKRKMWPKNPRHSTAHPISAKINFITRRYQHFCTFSGASWYSLSINFSFTHLGAYSFSIFFSTVQVQGDPEASNEELWKSLCSRTQRLRKMLSIIEICWVEDEFSINFSQTSEKHQLIFQLWCHRPHTQPKITEKLSQWWT